jgi:hypothetical protein
MGVVVAPVLVLGVVMPEADVPAGLLSGGSAALGS